MRNLSGVQQLKKYIAKRKGRLLCIVLLAIGCSVLELLPAQIIAEIVNTLQAEQIFRMYIWVLLFGGTYVLASILALVFGNLVMNFNNEIIEDVRTDAFQSVIHREVKVTEPDISSDIVTRLTGDIEQITRVLTGPLNGFLIKMVLIQHIYGIPSLRQTYQQICDTLSYRLPLLEYGKFRLLCCIP